MISSFLSGFNKGHERSIKARKNIFFLVLIKSVSILANLLLVPMAIGYENKDQYGVWLTVSSIVLWFSFFDIGLSNGMRNKFVEALSKGDERSAKAYVSTTYFSLAILFSLVWVIFVSINQHLDWCAILKIPESNADSVRTLVFIIFSYFVINFILKTLNTVLTANQQPAKASLIDVFGQLLSLLIIFILTKTTQGSLIYLGLGLTIAPLFILITANLVLFGGEYKKYAPSLKLFKIEYLKNIFGLSFRFFVIQIAGLIQYQTANFIIARSFSMESVTDYNVVFKYFNVLLMGFTLLLIPFWSASTEAFAKNDYVWIKNAVKRYKQILLLFVAAGIIMLLVSSFVYDFWVHITTIPFVMSAWCLVYVITSIYGAIHVNLLNGIGAIKIQFCSSLITPVLFILLCLLFIDVFQWGVFSLFIASIVSNLNGIVLAPLQYRKIFIEKKGGIWKA
ncbi:MAG: polysaccharide biosynthesis protein [Candidatus Symbiothrix sp.]|jgi:O-antigen/teichoic acid export membrane protein|nr:polysaccharide biosynthesis protein [Candidatus Symbiothrix sp.]